MESNNHTDILEYYKKAICVIKPHEALFFKFLLHSGLRPESEGILAFNLIIQLSRESKLSEYYNDELNCLCHYKYKQFLRKTKNAYLTFISADMINEIVNSKPIVETRLRASIESHKLTVRLKEFRKYNNTFLINHGFSELEVNLLSGRINGVLLRNYFTPKLSELGARVLKALETIDTQ